MLNELAKETHETAVEHGWWDPEPSFGDIIALCHSELSEALEEYRNGHERVWHKCTRSANIAHTCNGICPACEASKPEGIAVELADCIIRILDYCGCKDIDIDEIVHIKTEYNKTRPYRHGGKGI